MLVWVVDAGSFGIVVAYLMVAISFLVLRYRRDDMPRPYRLRNGKFMGGLGILLALALCVLYLPGSPSALVMEEWIVVLAWCLLGLVFFLWSFSVARRTTPAQQIQEE
jgi:amino acid transporter